jgi:NAD(P)-dependent dehydrogenase (short-subunit alcohol dehydrogenase family)
VTRGCEGDSPLATRAGLGRLAGRTAVVVGGGASGPGIGNGRATAVVLAREGAAVVVVDINRAAAQDTAALVEAAGGTVTVVVADVTSATDCAAVVEQTVSRYGRLDILVNSVGVIGPPASVVDVDLTVWDDLMRVNVTAIVLMSRCAIPVMPADGAIVNLSSIAGLRESDRIAYSTAKAAIIGLTRTMAGQHGPAGIRVNAVCPGAVWTPLVTNGLPDDAALADLREARRVGNLLRTEGTGWDTAYLILFLVSDEARWITGQSIVVDGGMTMSYRVGS